MKKFYLSLAALAVVVSGVALFGFLNTNSEAAIPRDCDNNAIIKCGSETASELAKDYNADKSELSKIYNHYGISESEVLNAGSKAKMGRVYKDGTVKVDGKVIATDAYSIGRQDFGNSKKVTIGGKTYYERSTQTSFIPDSISAFVFFDANGDFKAAILTACGNPVRAKKPVYKCENLAKKAVSRNRYEFTATATAKDGAKVSSYTFDFGDGNKQTTTDRTIAHTYSKAGTYTVTVTVKVKINNSYYKETTSSSCKVSVSVVEPTYACTGLTKEKISRTAYEFTAAATAENGAKLTGYKFDFGDGTTKDSTEKTVLHTYEKAGDYTVKVWAKVAIDGKETKEVTSSACEVKITVDEEPPTPVYSCDALSKEKITNTKYNFTGAATAEGGAEIVDYTFDFGDGTTAVVTNPTDVPHEYAAPGDYTITMTAKVKVNGEEKTVSGDNCVQQVTVAEQPEECKPGIPVGHPDCEEECKPGIPVGDAACEELPAELPTTGPAEMIGGVVGLGSLVAAGYYWFASRRGLMNEMLNR